MLPPAPIINKFPGHGHLSFILASIPEWPFIVPVLNRLQPFSVTRDRRFCTCLHRDRRREKRLRMVRVRPFTETGWLTPVRDSAKDWREIENSGSHYPQASEFDNNNGTIPPISHILELRDIGIRRRVLAPG